jgi:small subunit ribosomal protein S16
MLVIRMARTGRTKYPTYRIVAADSKRAATGSFVAMLGHYNPHTKELVIKREETMRFLENGAQPSNTVLKLMVRDGIELPKWAKLKTKGVKVDPSAATAAEPEASTDAPVDAEVKADSNDETPAPADEERVGMVAEESAVAKEDKVPNMATQETAASEEALAAPGSKPE